MSKSISKEKRLIIYNKYNCRCAYCGIKLTYDSFFVDHIKPIYRGSSQKELSLYGITKGDNSLDNLNPSCKSCNSSKSVFSLEKWREEIKQKHLRLLKNNSTYKILKRFDVISFNEKQCENLMFYFEKIKKI